MKQQKQRGVPGAVVPALWRARACVRSVRTESRVRLACPMDGISSPPAGRLPQPAPRASRQGRDGAEGPAQRQEGFLDTAEPPAPKPVGAVRPKKGAWAGSVVDDFVSSFKGAFEGVKERRQAVSGGGRERCTCGRVARAGGAHGQHTPPVRPDPWIAGAAHGQPASARGVFNFQDDQGRVRTEYTAAYGQPVRGAEYYLPLAGERVYSRVCRSRARSFVVDTHTGGHARLRFYRSLFGGGRPSGDWLRS